MTKFHPTSVHILDKLGTFSHDSPVVPCIALGVVEDIRKAVKFSLDPIELLTLHDLLDTMRSPIPALASVIFHLAYTIAYPVDVTSQTVFLSRQKDAKVLILGGGVAGVIAARSLHEQGIDDFIVVEARHELGGRLMSRSFGQPGAEWTIEAGANWVHGTQAIGGPANPIWELARKHNVSLHSSSYFGSICK